MPTGTVQVLDYNAWNTITRRTGGVPVYWPFKSGLYGQYYGKPAARYTSAVYVTNANAGAVPTNAPTQTDAQSQYVWVLAPSSAWAGAPQTMTGLQQFLNAAFTTGDKAAGNLGLPSLRSIDDFIKSLGRDALLLGGVIAVAWYLINRARQ